MDFSLTKEQAALRTSAIALVEEHIAPLLDSQAPDRPLPKPIMLEIYAGLAELGLTAPRVPAAHGGGGLRMLDYGIMFEQLPPVISISLIAHECTIARLSAEGDAEQRARFLPALIAGKKLCCTATTEPGAGSDLRAITTSVTAGEGHLCLRGHKTWITNATICDVMTVTCRDGEVDGHRLRRLVVDREESPFETRPCSTLGLQQGHLGEVLFDDCPVPAANAIGADGDAARILTLTWNGNRPLAGLAATHIAQKALDLAARYAGKRVQFGKPIGGHQLVQAVLADIETLVVTSRLACLHALDALDREGRSNGLSALAKRYATTACEKAVSLAMHVHGALGVSQECGLERLYRDVRMLPIPEAADNILTLIQGRELTGIAAFGS